MTDLYNAPELRNYFCKNMCPLGEDLPKAEMADLDRITVRTLSAIRKLGETRELLLDITEDGVIDESEKEDMEKVLHNLEELEQDIIKRDRQDMERETSPLKQAEDAVLLDTSDMSIEDAVSAVVKIYQAGKGGSNEGS